MDADKYQERAYALIASYRADADRYRDRARAVATLLATASGVLAAGLVFSPVGQSFPTLTKIAGYGAIVLLSVSVCFFLSGSMYRLPDGGADDDANALELSVQEFVEASESQTETVVKSITKRTRWGSGLGIGALTLLLAMGPLAVFYPLKPVSVSVQFLEPPTQLAACPALPGTIEGTASPSDLGGTSQLIPVDVSGKSCGDPAEAESRTIYFQRAKVLITAVQTR